MNDDFRHSWDISPSEAIEIQKKLAPHIIIGGRPPKIEHIAGVDLAFDKRENIGWCAIVVLRFPSLEPVEVRTGWDKISFPYVPGLLSFREAPLIISVFKTVEAVPDCIIFDGQGIAHPRRFGIASHVGLILGIPSIGCAKSRLYGLHEEPGSDCGSRSRLVDAHDQPIGVVLRTKKNVQPVFVSPGHLIGIEESADIIMECRDGYRIPAPTRLAHIRVGEYKRSMQSTWKA